MTRPRVCGASAQLFSPVWAGKASVCPGRCFFQHFSFELQSKIVLADGNSGFASLWCHPEARQLQGGILPQAQRELVPYSLSTGIWGSHSALPLYLLFTGFMAEAVHCNNLFFFFFSPGIHSRCRIVEDTCRNKPSSRGKKFPTLPILLSPTEVKAILLIIGCIKSLYKHRSPSRNPAVRFSSATHPKAFRAGKLQGYHVFPGTVLKVIEKQLSHCLEHP